MCSVRLTDPKYGQLNKMFTFFSPFIPFAESFINLLCQEISFAFFVRGQCIKMNNNVMSSNIVKEYQV